METSILYCILVHDSPRQTLRLLRSIYNSQDFFVVHVDQSASPAYQNLLRGVSEAFPRIRLISNHICSWGGYSLVEAEIDMIRQGLAMNSAWTHAMILSGAHLPVWPMARIRDWLVADKSFMICNEIPRTATRPAQEWIATIWDRFNWHYEEIPGLGMKRGEHAGPPDFIYAKGSQWVALARAHAQYAGGSAPNPIRDRLATTAIPDEAFFQTVLMNSSYRNDIIKARTTQAVWGKGRGHPEVLDLAAYQEFAKTAEEPFIRKFADDLGAEAAVNQTLGTVLGAVEQPAFQDIVYRYLLKGQLG